jgi:CheY-like chemotaxis protein
VILLVDDDCDQCEALAELLALWGHSVQCAADGNRAFQLMADSPTLPSVILLDLQMPGLDGWGFLAERNKRQLVADVPVVIVSGSTDIELRAMEAGAVAVLRKPVQLQTLRRTIEHFE